MPHAPLTSTPMHRPTGVVKQKSLMCQVPCVIQSLCCKGMTAESCSISAMCLHVSSLSQESAVQWRNTPEPSCSAAADAAVPTTNTVTERCSKNQPSYARRRPCCSAATASGRIVHHTVKLAGKLGCLAAAAAACLWVQSVHS